MHIVHTMSVDYTILASGYRVVFQYNMVLICVFASDFPNFPEGEPGIGQAGIFRQAACLFTAGS